MDRIPVESTQIKSVGYDRTTQMMEIEFNGGALYRYEEVPETMFISLRVAKSKGSFFHKLIRGKFITTKILTENVTSRTSESRRPGIPQGKIKWQKAMTFTVSQGR